MGGVVGTGVLPRRGRNHPLDGSSAVANEPWATKASGASAAGSASTDRRYVGRSAEGVVGRLNRMMSGWANYFTLGQVPGLQGRGQARDPAAATVVLAEAQGEVGKIRALLRRKAAARLRSHAPWVNAPRPSVGEGMIPAERDAGGWKLWDAGLRTKRKA